MTKSKSQPGGLPDAMTNPFAVADLAGRAQALWSAQGAALEHMRSFFDGWYARRREAAASAADCCMQMTGNSADLPAAARVWSEWASDEMERLREDLSAQTALATGIVADVAGGFSANGAAHPRRRKAHAEPAESD